VYNNVLPGLISSPQQMFAKLADLDNFKKSQTSVVGAELVRQDLEPTLRMAANVLTPVRNRLNRIQGDGNAHSYYVLTSNFGVNQTTVKFLGTDPTGGAFAKGGLPTAVDPQYSLIARPYANIGDVLNVAWQDIAQDRSFIDIKAQQRHVKMVNTGLIEEYVTLNGDSVASGGLQYDGLLTQVKNGGYNILDVSSGGGSPVKISLISQLCFQIQKAGGLTRALVMSYGMKQMLTQVIGVNYYGIRQTSMTSDGKVSGGVELESWNFGTGEVALIADQYMIPDPVTGLENVIFLDDETDDPKNTGKAVQMVDVDSVHYAELANISTADRGIVYETTMLQVGVLQFQGLLKGFNLAVNGSLQ
jgi:hypothetical protein